jgi:Amt family ammonium transporter
MLRTLLLLLPALAAAQTLADAATGLNNTFVFFCAVLVLLMHVGFAMLEAGSVQPKNRSSILLKNVLTLSMAGIAWFLFGYQLANGAGAQIASGFLGQNTVTTTYLAMADLSWKDGSSYIGWFFGFAFAATAATIVSGAVAERVSFKGYLIFAFVMTAWIYPVVAYWAWNAQGWLRNAGQPAELVTSVNMAGAVIASYWEAGYWSKFGYMDFAGSGVVHMAGAVAALVASIMMGPRKFMGPMLNPDGTQQADSNGNPVYLPRFEEDGTVNEPPSNGAGRTFSTLGALILWVGWYGFNPGTQLAMALTTDQSAVGLCAVNTTLCPCAAVVTYAILAMFTSYVDLNGVLNVALTGLVAITCSCDVVMPWAAICIGILCGPVYIGGSYILKFFKVDDVVDAIPVHGFGGIWGLFIMGFIVDNRLAGGHDAGVLYNGTGAMLLWQLIGILCIAAWVAVNSALVFGLLHYVVPMITGESWLRVNEEEEKDGFDETIRKSNLQAVHTPQRTAAQPVADPETELEEQNPVEKEPEVAPEAPITTEDQV